MSLFYRYMRRASSAGSGGLERDIERALNRCDWRGDDPPTMFELVDALKRDNDELRKALDGVMENDGHARALVERICEESGLSEDELVEAVRCGDLRLKETLE